MDIATLLGLILGISLVLWAMLSKGTVEMFMDPAGLAIVAGGTLGVALMSFPLMVGPFYWRLETVSAS